jgi:hypothetical protein
MYETECFAFTIQEGIQWSNIEWLTMIFDTAVIESNYERPCWQLNSRWRVLRNALCFQYQRAQNDCALNGSQWYPTLKCTRELKSIDELKHGSACVQVALDFSEWCRNKEWDGDCFAHDLFVQHHCGRTQQLAVHTQLYNDGSKVTTLHASHKAKLCTRDFFW